LTEADPVARTLITRFWFPIGVSRQMVNVADDEPTPMGWKLRLAAAPD
jgi:hypothetical protein